MCACVSVASTHPVAVAVGRRSYRRRPSVYCSCAASKGDREDVGSRGQRGTIKEDGSRNNCGVACGVGSEGSVRNVKGGGVDARWVSTGVSW